MNTNIQTFGNNLSTPAAHPGRIGGVHSNEVRTSFFDFVRQHLPEHPQRRIVRGKGEVAVTGHKCEVQVFDSDKTIRLSQSDSQFMPKITALIGDMILQFGDLSLGIFPAGAGLLAARQASLSNTQVTQRFTKPTRVVNQCAVGQGQ